MIQLNASLATYSFIFMREPGAATTNNTLAAWVAALWLVESWQNSFKWAVIDGWVLISCRRPGRSANHGRPFCTSLWDLPLLSSRLKTPQQIVPQTSQSLLYKTYLYLSLITLYSKVAIINGSWFLRTWFNSKQHILTACIHLLKVS